jgi:hypothetical protein
MELTARAAAGGFAAFTLQEVERSWGQRPLGGHRAQEARQGAVLAPEPLPENREIRRHLYLVICIEYRLQVQNAVFFQKSKEITQVGQKTSFLGRFVPLPPLSESQLSRF